MLDEAVLNHYDTSNHRLRVILSQPIGGRMTELSRKDFARRIREMEEERGQKFSKAQRAKFREEYTERHTKARKRLEDRIQSRLQEGQMWNFSTYRYFMAGDLAWNTQPFVEAQVPIMAWAAGKISLDDCYAQVADLCDTKDKAKEYFRWSEGKLVGISEEKMTDISINMVRPYVRRAVAALSNQYNRLYPFAQYDPRVRSMVGKLRADLLSQRMDIMADQFGYRRDHTQMLRGMFLHSNALALKSVDWVREKQIQRVPDESATDGHRFDTVIVKEGVKFRIPHPTRFAYDQSAALARLNFDDGPQWICDWDVRKFSEIRHDTAFFNRDTVPFQTSLGTTLDKYSAYFQYAYDKTINVALAKSRNAAERLQRSNNIDFYSGNDEDQVLWFSNYYERVVPSQVGLGDYPHPLWLHVIVAGDRTPVYARWLSSAPGYVYSYDEMDSQVMSPSMAMEILPYQERTASLFNTLMHLLGLQSTLLLVLDADIVPENIRQAFKEAVAGKRFTGKVHYAEKSQTEEELWEKTYGQKQPINLFQPTMGKVIDDLFRGIAAATGMLEKNLMMSPNEMGSFNQRETQATEVVEVAKSTNALNGYKSEGVGEGRMALKKILYDSYMANGSPKVRLSVQERYPDSVIKAAGFEVEPMEDGYVPTVLDKNGKPVAARTLIGTKNSLIHDYTFTSRDGTERAASVESAKVLMELLRYLFSAPPVLEAFIKAFGPEKITEMVSEVFRLSGSPITLKPDVAFTEEEFVNALRQADSPEKQAEAEQMVQQAIQGLTAQIQPLLAQLDERLRQVEAATDDYLSQSEAQAGIT